MHPTHSDKANAFAEAVAIRVDLALRGQDMVFTECDYDPQGLLLDAVREVIDPQCRGFGFSARGILPEKHSLDIAKNELSPKEGYGNWMPAIPVPEQAREMKGGAN